MLLIKIKASKCPNLQFKASKKPAVLSILRQNFTNLYPYLSLNIVIIY